jgi:hypothetical protein
VPLGLPTLAEMLAESTMVRSPDGDSFAIQTFATSGPGSIRDIITYSLATGHAILVASGPARGWAMMSWSPTGATLAIFDGDPTGSTLTMVTPPE